ncbi:MAG: IMP dehydrogenase [Spirochaetales bacterium]|jgi:IMP dehydrogenase|nr:IMP dehydrogenase [Spirochaetales bacterium]
MIEESLSYDDVLLLPGYADFLPGEADVRSRLVGDIYLNIPIVSSAMDTVTEEEMAIAIALEGGVGVIHRNMSPKEQAEQVAAVKRFLNWIIDTPVTVQNDQSLHDVDDLMKRYRVSGLLVLNADGKLCGIITSRDMKFCSDFSRKVEDLMTPDPIVEDGEPEMGKALKKFHEHKVEKLPVVDREGRLKGLITVKDIEKHQHFPSAALDANGRLLVGAAISPGDLETRLPLLQDSKADFIVLDTAHGDSRSVIEAVKLIKKRFPAIPVVGGNVATREGARRLIEAGSDAIKVGVGPGSICTTRIVAGIGVPQFSAVLWCAEEAARKDIPVIADGGIKYSGDIVKAIGAGAEAVMIGNLFAGLKESPGREIIYEGRIFKQYRGMGSIAAIRQGGGERYQMSKDEDPVPEGVEGRVPYKGNLKPFIYQLVTGLRKGMGYCGCHTINELRNYKKFIKITPAGLKESHAHDVAITQEPPNYSR